MNSPTSKNIFLFNVQRTHIQILNFLTLVLTVRLSPDKLVFLDFSDFQVVRQPCKMLEGTVGKSLFHKFRSNQLCMFSAQTGATDDRRGTAGVVRS
jgi:hypothetical protein